MKRTFAEALEHRRSYYSIGSDSPVLDEEVVHIIRTAVKNVPSAFNSQSTRIVLLLGDEHKKLWDIVKNTLKRAFRLRLLQRRKAKIDGCFAAGHGTVLYFEDTTVVKKLQDAFPSYSEKLPDLVAAYIGHAPAGCLDHAGRRRFGSFLAALQPAD